MTSEIRRVLFSVGHSNLPKEALLERLLKYRIDRLVDVRTKPYSRYSPQYSRQTLEWYLAEHDINYDWRGGNLGGLGPNVLYQETLKELVALAADEQIALMCSELAPEKCHRYTLLTPALEKLGGSIIHI